jgi:hypothetical protein
MELESLSLESIPGEIFRYISVLQLLSSLKLVCTTWKSFLLPYNIRMVSNHPCPPIPLAIYSTSIAQKQVPAQESSPSTVNPEASPIHLADPKTNNATGVAQQPSLVSQLSESGLLWDSRDLWWVVGLGTNNAKEVERRRIVGWASSLEGEAARLSLLLDLWDL